MQVSTTGSFLWTLQGGGAGNDVGKAMAVDEVDGDVYTVGSFANTATFGPVSEAIMPIYTRHRVLPRASGEPVSELDTDAFVWRVR